MNEPVVRLLIRHGALYLSAAACEQYFSNIDAVALVQRGGALVVLPVRYAAAGGYLLKRRNRRGDRVVSAPDFFRACGFDDDAAVALEARWDDRQAALVASGLAN